MSPRAPLRVALYARISQDDSGEAAGVGRQLDDLRALARDRGWTIVAELVDNDRSAYGKRPAYAELLTRVAAGELDRVAVWHLSRLLRSRHDRLDVIETFGRHRVGVAAVRGPELDLSSAAGRMLADLMSAFDAYESEVKGERVARAAAQRREQGRPNGPLGYGWRKRADGSYGIDRGQAAIVREIVRRIGAGESIRSVADDLSARGVPTPYGRDSWGPSSVRKLAVRRSSAAQLVHDGTVIGSGEWPALVTPAELDAVDAALARNARPRDPDARANGADGPAHLLTAHQLGRCAVCGSSLRMKPDRRGRPLYVCAGRGGCVGRDQQLVDELTEATVIAYLGRREHRRALTRRPAQPGLDDDAREQLAAADVLLAAGRIDRATYDALTAELLPGPAPVVPAVVRRAAVDPAAAWAAATLAERVELLRALDVVVTIDRQARGPWSQMDSVRVAFGAAS